MPGDRPDDAFVFEERLSLPWFWWAIAAAVVAVGAVEIGAGFTWDVMLGVFAALAAPTLTLLLLMGHTRVRVDRDGVQVGRRSLGYDEMDTVEALDSRRTRDQLGPAGDPAAHVVTRGWIHTSVLIRLLAPEPTPYWLISTRRPDELIATLTRLARR